MKIARIAVDHYGPLCAIDWDVPDVAVVYDDNMSGKTSLVDVLVRQLFIPQRGSKLFRNYQRFNSRNSEKPISITVDIEHKGTIFPFGKDNSDHELKELLGWTEEALFRLLCIREGDNRLVTGSWERRSVFHAAASLISGVGTEKVDLIDKDLREEFLITKGNDWSNRKGTAPPKIKDKIEGEILPFLDDFSTVEEQLYMAKEKRSEIASLGSRLKQKTKRERKLEEKLDLIRAKKLEDKVEKIRKIDKKLEKFARISPEDEETWQKAREKLERARDKLMTKNYQGKTLEEKRKTIKSELAEKKRLLNVKLDEKIQSNREGLRRLTEKEQKITNKIDEARKEAVNFLKCEVREPLKKLSAKEEKYRSLTFWEKRGSLLTWVSGGLIVGGVAATFLLPWPVAFAALFGLGLLILTRKKINSLHKLKREIRSLKDEVQSGFNKQFEEVIDHPVDDIETLEEIMEEIPGLVSQKVKEANNLQDTEKKKRELERELEKLQNEKEGLPEKIEELETKEERLGETINEAKEEKNRNKETINDLRDKTNLPDLEALRERLEEKGELKKQLDETKAVLTNELNTEASDLDGLLTLTEKKIEELRKDGDIEKKELPEPDDDLERASEQLNANLEELRGEIERLREEIADKRGELDNLRRELSRFDVDLENPADLFRKKLEMEESLREFALDRLSGSLAREIFDEVSSSYLNTLDQFISGQDVERTVEKLFSEAMGDQFKLRFNYDTNEFILEEDGLSYPETDLSSGGKKHLFYSTRLALVERIAPEPAFLILDDPFLFYQQDRKKKAINQLGSFINDGWQVLCFTVDDRTRDAMVEKLGAKEFAVGDLKE